MFSFDFFGKILEDQAERSEPQVHCFSFPSQLRGRVGRSGREGFTYLFYTDKSLLSRIAMVSSTAVPYSYFYSVFMLIAFYVPDAFRALLNI